MSNVEKELAALTAAFYRREISRLMQQAEHWKDKDMLPYYEPAGVADMMQPARVRVRPDELIFIAGTLRGLLDMIAEPDDGTQHQATVQALSSVNAMLAGYVPEAERKVQRRFAQRDAGADWVSP